MLRGLILLALTSANALLFSPAAMAYDEKRATNNFSHELVVCAVYYNIGAEGARRVGEIQAYESSLQVSNALIEHARKYSSDETVQSRFRLALQEQADLMHRDYANFSTLIFKYGDVCKQISENSQSRLDYWRQEE